jgi:precorrin-4/cobalt-precorrin-4 C11-methyltransferase
MPEGEDLESLAAHKTTLCLFLSITLLANVQKALLNAGWDEEAPILVVQKASWPDEEKIVRGTINNIREKCRAEKINSQAMIIATPALGARHWSEISHSKLYDADFTHRFRKASKQ